MGVESGELSLGNIFVCDNCGELLRYRYNIKVQSIKEVGPEHELGYRQDVDKKNPVAEQELIKAAMQLVDTTTMPLIRDVEAVVGRDNLDDNLCKTKEIQCPKCGAMHLGYFVISPIAFVTTGEIKPIVNAHLYNLTKQEQRFISYCESKGLLGAFKQALERSYEMNRPSALRNGGKRELPSTERAFIDFLDQMNPVESPSRSVLSLLGGNTNNVSGFQLWQSRRVVMFVSSAKIIGFIPTEMLSKYTQSLRHTNGNGFKSNFLKQNEDTLPGWVKLRYGYVPSDRPIFMAELHAQCEGIFSRRA